MEQQRLMVGMSSTEQHFFYVTVRSDDSIDLWSPPMTEVVMFTTLRKMGVSDEEATRLVENAKRNPASFAGI